MKLELIKSAVEDYFRIKINKQTRKREFVEARAFYYRFARMYTKASMASIGELVGKDHACVINGLNRLDGWMTYDKRILAYYSELDRLVRDNLNGVEDDYDFRTPEQVFESKYLDMKERYQELLNRYTFLVTEIREYDQKSRGMMAKVRKDRLMDKINQLINTPIEQEGQISGVEHN